MAASAIMTPLGLAALKAREGVRLQAYRDSVGVPTIGYGHTKGVRMGQTITQAQADALFLEDLASHALPILSCIKVPVADHERDALISIAFNIGVAGFRSSGFLARLNAGDRAGCATGIMLWRKPPEIVSRRIAERDQFVTPYTRAAPRARSTDARAVGFPVAAPAAAAPLPPILDPQAPPLRSAGETQAGLSLTKPDPLNTTPTAGLAEAIARIDPPAMPALPPAPPRTLGARIGNALFGWLTRPWFG